MHFKIVRKCLQTDEQNFVREDLLSTHIYSNTTCRKLRCASFHLSNDKPKSPAMNTLAFVYPFCSPVAQPFLQRDSGITNKRHTHAGVSRLQRHHESFAKPPLAAHTSALPMTMQRTPNGGPEQRDLFVPALVITAIIGYTLILAYDLAHSWGFV